MDFVLAERFAHGHGFRIDIKHHRVLPRSIEYAMVPRDAALVGHSVVPKDFAGSVLAIGAQVLLWPSLLVITPIFFALATAMAAAGISIEMTRARGKPWRAPAAAAFLLTLAAPAMLINGALIAGPETATAFATLLGCMYFLRYRRLERTRDLAVMIAALAGSVLLRYPNILFAAPLIVTLLLERRVNLRRAAVAIAVVMPFALAVGLFNHMTYGSWRTTGYTLGARLIARTVNFAGESSIKFRPRIAANHVLFYAVRWPMFLVPATIGLGLALRRARSTALRPAVAAMIAGSLALVAFHIGHEVYGALVASGVSSLLRYLLPVIALGCAFSGSAVGALRRPALPLSVVVVASFVTASFVPAGLLDRPARVRGQASLRTSLLSRTEPNAIIASSTHDPLMFGDRQVLNLTYLIHNDTPIEKGLRSEWAFLPDGSRFAWAADRITGEGIPFYLLADISPGRLRSYRAALRIRGMVMVAAGTSKPALYLIRSETLPAT